MRLGFNIQAAAANLAPKCALGRSKKSTCTYKEELDKPEFFCTHPHKLSNHDVQKEFLLDGRRIMMFGKIIGVEQRKGGRPHWLVKWRDNDLTEFFGIKDIMEMLVLYACV